MSNGWNVIIWLILAIILMIIEGLTVQLVSIWFVIGTIPAMIAAGLGASVPMQMLIFLIASIIALLITRPIIKRKINPTITPTNADRVIGMEGIVIQKVDNLAETGRVTANGIDWTARTQSNATIIDEGARILVLKIDGVKLIVEPAIAGKQNN